MSSWHVIARVGVAAALASLLGHRGLRKQSLDASGALAAFVVGFFSLASSYRFGALLLGFYFTGSKLTKVRAGVKQKLDANYKVGGQRSARQALCITQLTIDSLCAYALQVLACSVLATIIAVYYVSAFGDQDERIDFVSAPLRSFLLASYVGHYACCAADTWASELGVLSKSNPRLITSFRSVPPGTNGGVSLLGLTASALGGAFVGLLYLAMSLFSSTAQPQVVALGAITGLFGSLLDSLLGATLQVTWFDKAAKKICEERSTTGGVGTAASSSVEHVCGMDLLTNEQVNAVSVLVTTVVSGYLAQLMFP